MLPKYVPIPNNKSAVQVKKKMLYHKGNTFPCHAYCHIDGLLPSGPLLFKA